VKEALPGVRITVIQPSPFDDVTSPRFEAVTRVLVRYSSLSRSWRKEILWCGSELYPWSVALEKAKSTDAEAGRRKIMSDRADSRSRRPLLMAAECEIIGMPALVSAVELMRVRKTRLRQRDQSFRVEAGDEISWRRVR